MRLSVFTTITDPYLRGDNYIDAIRCYKDLADEVVVVDGGRQNQNEHGLNYVYSSWQHEFNWTFIGQQFQRGYEAATGGWVIHADLDFIFHENDMERIREVLSKTDAPAVSFYKWQFVLPDRYNLKSRLVLAVNKKVYGDRITFSGGGDLCQPQLDGVDISPDNIPASGIPFYNYDHMLKTKEQITEDVERMDRAYMRTFNKRLYSTDDRTAYEGWYEMAKGRFQRPSKHIPLSDHPKYVQETIKNLKPENFGYNGFGLVDGGVYA